MVNRQRLRNVRRSRELAGRLHRRERARNEPRDLAEADPPVEKGGDRDLVGGVERRRRRRRRFQRLDGERERGKAGEVRRLEGQPTSAARSGGRTPEAMRSG